MKKTVLISYMYTATVKNITLFCRFVKNSVKSKAFCTSLERKHGMLVISNVHNTLISSAVFMNHHWSHT